MNKFQSFRAVGEALSGDDSDLLQLELNYGEFLRLPLRLLALD